MAASLPPGRGTEVEGFGQRVLAGVFAIEGFAAHDDR
jgi:hypothetical protein